MTRSLSLFFLLLGLAWFTSGGLRPLLEPDEGRYAEIPREMAVSGDWVTPHLNGVAYLEKPPLQYWATAAAYKLFGKTELTARLWTLVLSFLALPLVWMTSKRLYGSPDTGLAAVVALAVSPYFVLVGQLNALDAAFATLLGGAVLALVVAQRATAPSAARLWMLAAWALLALAVLQKGIAAPVLAGATLVLYSLLSRDWTVWRRMQWLSGLAIFFTIVVPWFWWVAQRNPDFLQFFFIHEHFERFLTKVHRRVEPAWFFIPILLLALLPWWRVMRSTLRDTWQRRSEGGATGFRAALFLGLWPIIVFVFFSASGSKLATYVLPIMPVAAVLLAPQLLRTPRAVTTAAATTAVSMTVAALGLCVASAGKSGVDAVPRGVLIWAVLAALIAVVAWLVQRRRTEATPARWLPAALGAVLGWQALMFSYSYFPPLRTARDLVTQIRPHVGPQTTLYSVKQYRQSAPFYLDRTLRLVVFRGELDYGLERAPGKSLATLDEFFAEWQSQRDAVAFLSDSAYSELSARGLPGRVIGRDGRSIVMARQ
jgi:4-amino-4-deoxy-L-arabinose transferase-like glycosyltransferase